MLDMEAAYQDMQRQAANDRPKIPEAEFVRSLLPLLVNIDNVPDLDVSIWLTIAGNPHRAIDVANMQTGEVLFTVPPLLARSPTAMSQNDMERGGISAVLYEYGAKLKAESPVSANIWLEHNLRGSELSADQENIAEYLKQWVIIYSRYNLPLERLFGGVAPQLPESAKGKDNKEVDPSASQSANISDDVDDFD
jgi:hypothetical protein